MVILIFLLWKKQIIKQIFRSCSTWFFLKCFVIFLHLIWLIFSSLLVSSYDNLIYILLSCLPSRYHKLLILNMWSSGHLHYSRSLSKCRFLGLIPDLLCWLLECIPGIYISDMFLRWFFKTFFIYHMSETTAF